MQSLVQTAPTASPTSAVGIGGGALQPRLLAVTPDTGLMLRLTAAAEMAGWWVCWRPEASFGPEGGLPWAAIAIDADFGLAAFLQAQATRRPLLGVVGRWDVRADKLAALCHGFIERPVRPAEVAEVLTTLRPAPVTRSVELR